MPGSCIQEGTLLPSHNGAPGDPHSVLVIEPTTLQCFQVHPILHIRGRKLHIRVRKLHIRGRKLQLILNIGAGGC